MKDSSGDAGTRKSCAAMTSLCPGFGQGVSQGVGAREDKVDSPSDGTEPDFGVEMLGEVLMQTTF